MTNLRKVWAATLKKAGVPYFAPYELRHTFATRLSAGGVADEWVTQLVRQGDAKVFKKYSQMKLQMKREALQKLNRAANESAGVLGQFWDSFRPKSEAHEEAIEGVLRQVCRAARAIAHLPTTCFFCLSGRDNAETRRAGNGYVYN